MKIFIMLNTLSNKRDVGIGRVVVSTLGQIVVIAVVRLLFLEFDVLGAVGNKFHVARRRGNAGCVRLGPDGTNKSGVAGSARVRGIGTTRRIIFAT